MRILGHLDRFGPPVGGGVITTVKILQELAERGHEVSITTNRVPGPHFPGIRSYEAATSEQMRQLYQTANIVVPHMAATPGALDLARATGIPVVYPVHDDGQLELYGLTPDDVSLVIFNSSGLRDRSGWSGAQMVVHPPVWIHEHCVEQTGDAISIASLSREKGGETFWKLVERLPNRRFIGVVGGWGEQIIPDQVPENVEIMEHQGSDLRALIRRTRILLVPSQRLGEGDHHWTENWGRAAIEAAASGIPSIANPAPGPVEALGDAGIFCDRNDIDAWVRAIEQLYDPVVWARQSRTVVARAQELEDIVRQQLDQLSVSIDRIVAHRDQQRLISMD